MIKTDIIICGDINKENIKIIKKRLSQKILL